MAHSPPPPAEITLEEEVEFVCQRVQTIIWMSPGQLEHIQGRVTMRWKGLEVMFREAWIETPGISLEKKTQRELEIWRSAKGKKDECLLWAQGETDIHKVPAKCLDEKWATCWGRPRRMWGNLQCGHSCRNHNLPFRYLSQKTASYWKAEKLQLQIWWGFNWGLI